MVKPLFNNILISVHNSEASLHAIQYGILMSKLYNCKLTAVYVVDTATLKQLTLSKFFVQDESAEYEASLNADGMRYLNYAQELGKSKGVEVSTQLRSGAIWSEIIGTADEIKADLILLGGFDKEGVDQRDVLSTSYRKILVNANTSVLVVKEKMIEDLYKMA